MKENLKIKNNNNINKNDNNKTKENKETKYEVKDVLAKNINKNKTLIQPLVIHSERKKLLSCNLFHLGYWLRSSNAKRTYLSSYIHYFDNLALRLNNMSAEKERTRLITGEKY